MDVHPPHEPIHSARDFFLHLFTITVGLLIALGLEAAVERWHHHHLVLEAQADLREEIRANRNDLESTMQTYAHEIDGLNTLLQLIESNKSHTTPNGTVHIDVGFMGSTLSNASYVTAQNDGAFALMSYPDAKRYADIYTLQTEFIAEQRQSFQTAAAPLTGLMFAKGLALEKMDSSQLDHVEDLVTAYEGHIRILEAIGKQLDDDYRKF